MSRKRRRFMMMGRAVFTPDDLGAGAGLRMWQKADSLNQVDGTTVTTWSDLSGNGNNFTQATEANKPLFKTNIKNGLPVLRFDGAGDRMECIPVPGADTSWTFFIVAQKRSAVGAANQFLIGLDNATGNANLGVNTAFGSSDMHWLDATDTAIPSTVTNWNIYAVRINSAASLNAWANGGASTNLDPTDSVTTANIRSLCNNSGGVFFGDYDVAEFIDYSTALTNIQINQIGNYLSSKWAITWSVAS